jgi:hypothetical protein
VAQGHQAAATVNVLTLLAINAARAIQYRSSRRQAARSCAAIVLVRVVHNLEPETCALEIAR